MKKEVTMLGFLIVLTIVSSVVQLVHAQTKELKKIRLNWQPPTPLKSMAYHSSPAPTNRLGPG